MERRIVQAYLLHAVQDLPQEGAACGALAVRECAVAFGAIGSFNERNVVRLCSGLDQGFTHVAALGEGQFVSGTVGVQEAVRPSDLAVRFAVVWVAQGARPLGGQVECLDLLAHGLRFESEDARQLFPCRHSDLRQQFHVEQHGVEPPCHHRGFLTVREPKAQ